jgi:hypothetical protein
MFGRCDGGNITFWKEEIKIKIYSTVIHAIKKVSRMTKTVTSDCSIGTLRKKIPQMKRICEELKGRAPESTRI